MTKHKDHPIGQSSLPCQGTAMPFFHYPPFSHPGQNLSPSVQVSLCIISVLTSAPVSVPADLFLSV